jgi:hypothetical protein
VTTKNLLTLDLDDRQLAALGVLDDDDSSGLSESAATVLYQLVERVLDGVHRPGSWERAWLCQAFGDEWIERMEQDPQAAWRQRIGRRTT